MRLGHRRRVTTNRNRRVRKATASALSAIPLHGPKVNVRIASARHDPRESVLVAMTGRVVKRASDHGAMSVRVAKARALSAVAGPHAADLAAMTTSRALRR